MGRKALRHQKKTIQAICDASWSTGACFLLSVVGAPHQKRQQQQHILETRPTRFFSYSYSVFCWGFYTTSTTMLIKKASYTHKSAEVTVLHTPVEVRFSMTCRFVHEQRKRENVHIPAIMSVAFPKCCRVWRFHLVVWAIHTETERPRVKKADVGISHQTENEEENFVFVPGTYSIYPLSL